jgi:hypothetical protein
MELLSDPNVLFLDEPTTGLSSYDAFQVVKLLRTLAAGGKTVALTIHQPSIDIFKEFDNLIMVSRDKGSSTSGALAYYGPAYPDSIQFFSSADPTRGGAKKEDLSPEALLDGLAKRPTAEWVTRYTQSKHKREFIDSRAGQLPPAPAQNAGQARVRQFGFSQWFTLMRRCALLRLRDRGQVIFMALQATMFPLLMCAIFRSLRKTAFADFGELNKFIGQISAVHFLLVIAAVWFGCNNAARDIVGEWAIYLRERMVSLKLPSYVMSKLGLLAMICFVQCAVLLGIVYSVCGLKSGFGKTLLTLFIASQVGAALGLLISSFAETTESAIAVLPIPLLFMILLSGGIKPLTDDASRTVAMAFPSRWAFENNLLLEAQARKHEITVGGRNWGAAMAPAPGAVQYRPVAQGAPAPSTEHDIAENAFPLNLKRHSFGTGIAVLFGMVVALVGAVIGVLRSRDIQ